MEPDFWAEIEFVEGKSRRDGWRPDLVIPPDDDQAWMLWPVTPLSQNPVGFRALDRVTWLTTSSALLPVGTKFHLREGYSLVATGTVITAPSHR